jgi:hypothetical protein
MGRFLAVVKQIYVNWHSKNLVVLELFVHLMLSFGFLEYQIIN